MHIGTGPRAGHWMHVEPIELFNGTVTSDTDGASFELGSKRVLRLVLDVTEAVGDDPTLDVTVQGSQDATNWFTLGAFTQTAVAVTERKTFPTARFVRAVANIEGVDTGTSGGVVHTGTGLDGVTVSGEPITDDPGNITITLGGDRGVATFDWSACGESDTGVTTAATVVLGTTGLTAAFEEQTPAALSVVTRTGEVGPMIGFSGTPDADYDLRIEITTSGVEGVGVYRWSLDGGGTWEESGLTVPATPWTDALGTTGVTATFATALGSKTAVSKSGTGPNITVAGDPAAAYDVKILISKNGDLNVGEFYYSLDGGDTFDAVDVVIPVSGEYVLGATGLTLTFAAGAYVDGDVYSFTTTAPQPYIDNETYDCTATAVVPYVALDEYDWTNDNPDADASFTFSVSGEVA